MNFWKPTDPKLQSSHRKLISPDTHWLPYVPAAVLVLALIKEWALELSGLYWDWDIDHMMYFGQRVLAGELPWSVEFDDKLPATELIFALPAAFDSFLAWHFLSLTSVLVGAACEFLLVRDVLGSSGSDLPKPFVRLLSTYAALITVVGFSFLVGGIHHINPLAASLAIISTTILYFSARRLPATSAIVAVLFAAFLAGVAISIRPYLMLMLFAVPMWLTLRVWLRERPPLLDLWPSALGTAAWIAAIGVFAFAVNILPYALKGDLQSFFDGLSMLRQQLYYQPFIQRILAQPNAVIHLSRPCILLEFVWFAGAALSCVGALRGVLGARSRREPLNANTRLAIDLAILSAVFPLLIELLVLTRHFWTHYLQMFAPFAAIGIIGLVTLIRLEYPGAWPKWRLAMGCIGFLAATAFLLGSSKEVIALIRDAGSRSSPMELNATALNQYLETRPKDERTFLAPEDMYIHWLLHESRHGFPHAANTGHIASGMWANVRTPDRMRLPNTFEKYCAKLESEGPAVVVFFKHSREVDNGDGVIRCFGTTSVYQLAKSWDPSVTLFVRRDRSRQGGNLGSK